MFRIYSICMHSLMPIVKLPLGMLEKFKDEYSIVLRPRKGYKFKTSFIKLKGRKEMNSVRVRECYAMVWYVLNV